MTRTRARAALRVIPVFALMGTLAACGNASASDQPEVTVVTVTAAATPVTDGANGTNSRSVTSGVIPDVVGVNHQLAQDTMQAAGFYNLSEEDATGAGRMLINDRNWVVVSQSPAPGTRPASDVTVVLRSKKIGESSDHRGPRLIKYRPWKAYSIRQVSESFGGSGMLTEWSQHQPTEGPGR